MCPTLPLPAFSLHRACYACSVAALDLVQYMISNSSTYTCVGVLQDGALDDNELNSFQVKCFNAPLQSTELTGVKQVVGERLPGVSA